MGRGEECGGEDSLGDVGDPLGWPPVPSAVEQAGRGLAAAVASFTAAGWSVQTTRLALPPPPVVLGWREPGRRLPELARWLGVRTAAADVGYASLGMVPAPRRRAPRRRRRRSWPRSPRR